MAEATGLGIAQLESGKNFPNLTTITIICKFYNITLDEFFAPLNYPPKDK
ncbi:helix-turn-helix transcriptional regulator [Alistipes sp.]|nr:helix-turn-helix transcriptional regulator [Alistipes sp.]MDR3785436.1 helix-turn-helix transcriptional regulator [Alistipes sp.]